MGLYLHLRRAWLGSDVTKDGTAVEHYVYDANGNRTSATTSAGTVSGAFDARDRMETYGDATYTYLVSGELATKTVPGTGTTTYEYDELGSLTHIELANGDDVDYNVDGLGRRVTRKVNGTVTNRFQYGTGLQPVAELDAAGNTVSTFVYASRANVPDYMVKGGVNYRFVTDYVGSIRMVVNASTGAVAQRIDYDSFGSVLSDTNPGFQPFAFAGGLFDTATGLTRFGARDYDAVSGRWTARDPILFDGGDPNIYAYVGSDPVNLIDPRGLHHSRMHSAFGEAGEAFSRFVSGIKAVLGIASREAGCLLGVLANSAAVDFLSDIQTLPYDLVITYAGVATDNDILNAVPDVCRTGSFGERAANWFSATNWGFEGAFGKGYVASAKFLGMKVLPRMGTTKIGPKIIAGAGPAGFAITTAATGLDWGCRRAD